MRKSKSVIALIFLTLFSLFTLFSCKGESTNTALFIYISASNLEADNGSATKMLESVKKASKGLEVYGLAGGTKEWKNDYFSKDSTTFFRVSDKSLEAKSYERVNMASSNTFKKFIEFSETIKVENKVLLIWGHGSPYGLCRDYLYDDILSFSDFDAGLANSHFDLMIFNSCLTASLDLISFISKNTDYAIASEDVFPTSGIDYDYLVKALANKEKKNFLKIGKGIIDSTFNKYANTSLKDKITLSLFDLNEFKKLEEIVDILFFSQRFQLNEFFKAMQQANSITKYTKDFKDFLGHLENKAYNDALNGFIAYERHGRRLDTNGLYIYFKEDFKIEDYNSYLNNCYYDTYIKMLLERKRASANEYIKFYDLPIYIDDIINKKIDDYTYLAEINYQIYDLNNNKIKEDVLGLKTIIQGDEIQLGVNKEGAFGLSLNGINLPLEVYTYQDSSDSMAILYRAKASVNGILGDIIISYSYINNNTFIGDYKIIGFEEENFLNTGSLIKPLEVNDKIKIGDNEFSYQEMNLEKKAINEGYIKLIAYDVYGKAYETSLAKFKIDSL